MSNRLPLMTIETILRGYLHPYQCECRAESDSVLSVRLYGESAEGDELTVMGITEAQCRDAANLVRLAQELRFELYATRGGLFTESETEPAKLADAS